MTVRKTAKGLLVEWNKYKELHYSRKALFTDAIDIEIHKGFIAQLALSLQAAVLAEWYPEERLVELVQEFSKHLRSFKDAITIELLKHGIREDLDE